MPRLIKIKTQRICSRNLNKGDQRAPTSWRLQMRTAPMSKHLMIRNSMLLVRGGAYKGQARAKTALSRSMTWSKNSGRSRERYPSLQLQVLSLIIQEGTESTRRAFTQAVQVVTWYTRITFQPKTLSQVWWTNGPNLGTRLRTSLTRWLRST